MALICCIVIIGCSVSPEKNQSNLVKTKISVDNFTFSGDPLKIKFSKIPERIIVTGNSALDTLISLGLNDRIIAAVLIEDLNREKYQKLLPKANIYINPMPLENAVILNPDFLLGWRRSFSANSLGDTMNWQAKGIPAYIQDASGPIPAKGKFPACTLESEKNFLNNMGLIFNEKEQTDKFLAAIDKELISAQKQTKITKPKVLVTEFAKENIEVFGKDLLSGDLVAKLGGELLEYGSDAPFISQEELMQLEADVIFLVYHGKEEEKQNALNKFQNDLYQHIPAVKNKRIYPLKYSQIVAPGVKVIDTIHYMRVCMYLEK